MFDIVTPLGPDDTERFIKSLAFTRKNILGYRYIYIIAAKHTLELLESRITDKTNLFFVDENMFPFDFEDLAKYIGYIKRRGWYLQQLLKLYSGFIIPGILPRWLVIDADTFFLKPTSFIEDGKMLLNISKEYYVHYFQQIGRLLPGIYRVDPKLGGICHHMMFEMKYVKDLFERVENIHRKTFWRAFMESIDPTEYEKSGASEYELYFNFMLIHHANAIKLRQLNWEDTYYVDTTLDRDYISSHEWMNAMFLASNIRDRK